MNSILLKKGRVIDPSRNLDGVYDVLLENGRIKAIDKDIAQEAQQIIDARGIIVAPGFIDIHAHLREPGYEEKETIATGTKAAAAGGFTAVACMANTNPVNDNAAITRWILDRSRETGIVRVWPIGAVSVGLCGERMSEMADMRREGAVAFSDDGKPIMNSQLMRSVLEYSLMLDCPIIDHCEDLNLTSSGVMHEGIISARLGLSGWPSAAEASMVARDIFLAQLTGAHVHIAHVSTRESIELIKWAKEQGLRVTAEVTPHHFTLTDQAIEDKEYHTSLKVNPPLRQSHDVEALIDGLRSGVIQAIATDHAPHDIDSKRLEFNLAAFGMIGFETAVSLAIRQLILPGHLDWPDLIRLFTTGPAQILHMKEPSLQPGNEAHLTLISPTWEWTYHVEQSYSKSRNSPFDGWTFKSGPVMTIVNGKIVYERKEAFPTHYSKDVDPS